MPPADQILAGGRGDAITHVLFDLDGTIADSHEGIIRSLEHGFAGAGLPVPPVADLVPLIGPPLSVGLHRFGLDAAQIDSVITRYRERYAPIGIFEVSLYAGVVDLLARLVQAGHVLAVATSKPEPFARQIIEHFSLDAHFTVIAGATFDETRAHKAEIVGYALAQLPGATPANTVMVGDREHDVLGAAVHGLRAIGVTWGFGTHHELVAAGAWQIADDAAALGAMLLALPARTRSER